jgi:malate dehydrogenase (oxaloacetate-decarboxylating)(NADP+)
VFERVLTGKNKNKKGESYNEKEALQFHAGGKPGKIEISSTKPMETQSDLSLAYSPGVAAPVLAINDNPETVYDFTSKGNLVAVISNGSAILGLGNLGPLAAKPVMEGKAVLFKRFADVDAIDLEIDSQDADIISNIVEKIAPSFGGINLEDISAPDCFIIESQLREKLNIPVFHDDQHGTAVIATAGIINALDLTNKKMSDIKVVVNGAGAAGIACLELLKSMGLPHDNTILCDSSGPIYFGREKNINQWKAAHACKKKIVTLADAIFFLHACAAFHWLIFFSLPEYIGPNESQRIVLSCGRPIDFNNSKQAIPAAPAPLTTTLISEIFLFVRSSALIIPAVAITAVPC